MLRKLYIVLKDKFGSLTIVDIDGKITPIQSYGVEQYFRIGAGDILAASLAYAWGEKRKSLPEAADYASRALAYFVDGARLPLPLSEFTTGAVVSKPVNRKIRVVGAGSDTLQRHLMLFHAHEWIAHLGGHLDAAQLPLATIDGHILEADDDCLYFVIISEDINAFNIPRQFKKVKHLPTVVFCPKDYVKFVTPWFINARITDDFATALYHAFRTA